MSVGGLLIGVINIAIAVCLLVLIGYFILWVVEAIASVSIPIQIQKLYLLLVALVAIAMLVALALGAPVHVFRWSFVSSAYAHEAPSGWHYPPNCCGGNDCRPVDCDSIVETPTGYDWHGLHWSAQQASVSGDQQCHVCYSPNGVWSSDGNGGTRSMPLTRCIFLLPTA